MKPDLRDIACVLGLGMVGGGLGMVHVPSALIVPGLILILIATFGVRH